MPEPLAIVAPLLIAGVLLASGIGKLRSGSGSVTEWADLGVPAALRRPGFVAAHPYGEIALAVLLVTLGGTAGVVVRAAALVLLLAYLALVVGALSRPEPVPCNCFGAAEAQPVTRWMAWRNAWLVAIGVVALAVGSGPSLWARMTSTAGAAWWVLAVAAAAVTAVLVRGAGGRTSAGAADDGAAEADSPFVDDGDLEYIRVRTPAVPVVRADGTTETLRELSSRRAQLILHVSESCAACEPVIANVDTYRARLPQLDVRLLLSRIAIADSRLASTVEPQTLHDIPSYVSESIGYDTLPSAFALGIDGLVAGGPVSGIEAIDEFVNDIAAAFEDVEAGDSGEPSDEAAQHPTSTGSVAPLAPAVDAQHTL